MTLEYKQEYRGVKYKITKAKAASHQGYSLYEIHTEEYEKYSDWAANETQAHEIAKYLIDKKLL